MVCPRSASTELSARHYILRAGTMCSTELFASLVTTRQFGLTLTCLAHLLRTYHAMGATGRTLRLSPALEIFRGVAREQMKVVPP